MGPISPSGEGFPKIHKEPVDVREKVDEFLSKADEVKHLAFLPDNIRELIPDNIAATIDHYMRMASWVLTLLIIWTASTLAEFRGVATYEWLVYLAGLIIALRFVARAGF